MQLPEKQHQKVNVTGYKAARCVSCLPQEDITGYHNMLMLQV